MDFKQILNNANIQTRLVACTLNAELSKCTESNKAELEKEFAFLSQKRLDSITQWLNKMKSKAKTQDSDEVVLEMLSAIYQKLEALERKIDNKQEQHLKLESSVNLSFIGHSVLCFASSILEEQQTYYVRMLLPVFPERYIGVFGIAIHSQILHIKQIHSSDLSDFDGFVAQMDRIGILDSKKSKN